MGTFPGDAAMSNRKPSSKGLLFSTVWTVSNLSVHPAVPQMFILSAKSQGGINFLKKLKAQPEIGTLITAMEGRKRSVPMQAEQIEGHGRS